MDVLKKAEVTVGFKVHTVFTKINDCVLNDIARARVVYY